MAIYWLLIIDKNKMDESFERPKELTPDDIELMKKFIKEHAKKRGFKMKLKIHYLSHKYRLEDLIYKIKTNIKKIYVKVINSRKSW